MKRVTAHVNDSSEILCHKVRRAFLTMERRGRKPYVYNGGVAGELIRVHVDAFYYSYNPRTRKYVRTDLSGSMRWMESRGTIDFLRRAQSNSRGKFKSGPLASTESQKSYIESMCKQLSVLPNKSSYDTIMKASRLIDDLKIRTANAKIQRLNQELEDVAANPITPKLVADENPYDPGEPRTSKVNGKVKPYKSIGLQFNRHEWWELERAVGMSKRSVNSIIRDGIIGEVRDIREPTPK